MPHTFAVHSVNDIFCIINVFCDVLKKNTNCCILNNKDLNIKGIDMQDCQENCFIFSEHYTVQKETTSLESREW